MLRLSLIFCLLTSPALAQSPIAEILCAPTLQMREKLESQFGESREASGLRSPEEMMEVWTDASGGWTLVVTYASGTSCIVAMGENWVRDQGDPA